MSILGFIFKFLKEHYPAALCWVEEMSALPKVVRIETDNLDAMMSALERKLQQMDSLLAVHDEKEEEDRFHEVMAPFHEEAKNKVKRLQSDMASTNESIVDLAAFYGLKVKPSAFKFEEFFKIFDEFRSEFVRERDRILQNEAEKEKARKKQEAQIKRAQQMAALREKKKAEKERKRRAKEEKKRKGARKKKVGFGGDDAEDGAERKQAKDRRGKTDKMLDEMGDATKYLAKLRRNRKHNQSTASLLGRGGRKKSMFFKDAKPLLLGATLSGSGSLRGDGNGADME